MSSAAKFGDAINLGAEWKIYGIINILTFVVSSILLIKYCHGCYVYYTAAEPKKDD